MAAVVGLVISAAGCSPSDDSPSIYDNPVCATQNDLTIISQPADVTVFEGQDAVFQGEAQGTAPIEYIWYVLRSSITDQTVPALVGRVKITASLADNGIQYYFRAINPCGFAVSSGATLTVLPASPRIGTPPTDTSVNEGMKAIFSVVATGLPPLTYQWKRNGVAIAVAADAPTYTSDPTSAAADDAAEFSVVVTNARGSIESAPARLTVLAAPAIVRGPMSQTVDLGQPATFDVVAAGAAPLKYQWLRNGADIAGATAASYSLASAALTDHGAKFSVRVSNAVLPAGVVSSEAILSVTPPSSIPRGAADIVSLRMDGTLGGPDSGIGGPAQVHALGQDGRYVAFVSSASLTSGGCGVFLRDMQLRQTRLITVKPDGSAATLPAGGNCLNTEVAMTPDARHVAFTSEHIDLVGRSFPAAAVKRAYVRDTCIGAASTCVPRTTLVSVDDADATLPGNVESPSISDNGRYVGFAGRAPNHAAVVDAAVLHDRDTDGNGVYDERPAAPDPNNPTFRSFAVSRQNNGSLFTAGYQPMISGNGRYVVFIGSLLNGTDCLVPNAFSGVCVYVYDRDANNSGVLDETTVSGGVRTINVSISTGGAVALGASVGDPMISADGRVVTFRTQAGNLGAAVPALNPLYVHDRDVTASGFFDTAGNVSTQVASRDAAGTEVPSAGRGGISRRGRFVLLQGQGSWAPPTDPNGEFHLYLRDTCVGAAASSTCVPGTVRLSVRGGGALPAASPTSTHFGALSGDGRRVAFSQQGGGLVDLDANGLPEEHTNREVYYGSTGMEEP